MTGNLLLDHYHVSDRRYPASLEIGWHDHELASLSIVTEGAYDERYGRRCREATAGLLIFHPPGERHADRHAALPTRILTVEIAQSRFTDLPGQRAGLDAGWDRRCEVALMYAARLRAELHDVDPLATIAAEATVLELVGWAAGHLAIERDDATWLLSVRDYLDSRAFDPPTMDDIARVAGVHPVHVARCFRRRIGCSIGGYLRRTRLARAMHLLQHTEMPLAEIAAIAGFADQPHLTRAVSRGAGRPPAAWRRHCCAVARHV